jgi:hypothetical protein
MANLLLRSPQYIDAEIGDMLSATLELSIDGTLRYTITKNAIEEVVVFDISEISRDYISHSFGQTNPSETIAITYSLKAYDDVNGTGSLLNTVNGSHTGFDGYGEFSEGVNPTLPSSNTLQSNTDIYLPPNTASYIPRNDISGKYTISSTVADGTVIGVGLPSINFTVHRVCDPKFTESKITFVNKFGALQELYFFFKSTERMSTSSETYKANIFQYSTADYSTTEHQVATYNVNAKETISLNTPYVADNYNLVIEELLLSEHIWLTRSGTTSPVRPKTSSFDLKTKVNDKLVQYTLEFEYAFDKINNVR